MVYIFVRLYSVEKLISIHKMLKECIFCKLLTFDSIYKNKYLNTNNNSNVVESSFKIL